jgi:hypothetical protein
LANKLLRKSNINRRTTEIDPASVNGTVSASMLHRLGVDALDTGAGQFWSCNYNEYTSREEHSEPIGFDSRLPLFHPGTFDQGCLLKGLTVIMTLQMQ